MNHKLLKGQIDESGGSSGVNRKTNSVTVPQKQLCFVTEVWLQGRYSQPTETEESEPTAISTQTGSAVCSY